MSARRSRATRSPAPLVFSSRRVAVRPLLMLQRSQPARAFGTLAYEVNARCLAMLAHDAPPAAGSADPVAQLRELSASVDAETRRRLAQVPYLLVDMRFRDERWWLAAREAPRARPAARGDLFPRVAAVRLARAVLMLVWNGLHSNPAAACVLYGISTPVARVILQLTLDDLDEIARKHFRQVTPRWEDRAEVWEDLVYAAQMEKSDLMRVCNLHALRLLTGEFLDAAEAARPGAPSGGMGLTRLAQHGVTQRGTELREHEDPAGERIVLRIKIRSRHVQNPGEPSSRSQVRHMLAALVLVDASAG